MTHDAEHFLLVRRKSHTFTETDIGQEIESTYSILKEIFEVPNFKTKIGKSLTPSKLTSKHRTYVTEAWQKEDSCQNNPVDQKSKSIRKEIELRDATIVKNLDTMQKHVEWVSKAKTATKHINTMTELKRTTLSALNVGKKTHQTQGTCAYPNEKLWMPQSANTTKTSAKNTRRLQWIPILWK